MGAILKALPAAVRLYHFIHARCLDWLNESTNSVIKKFFTQSYRLLIFKSHPLGFSVPPPASDPHWFKANFMLGYCCFQCSPAIAAILLSSTFSCPKDAQQTNLLDLPSETL